MRKGLMPNSFIEKIADPKDRKWLGQSSPRTQEQQDAEDEEQLQDWIKSLLKRREVPYVHAPMFKASQLPEGWPDFTFAWRGVPMGWECKVGKEKIRPEQHRMHEKMRAQGWKIFEIRSLEEAQKILDSIEL